MHDHAVCWACLKVQKHSAHTCEVPTAKLGLTHCDGACSVSMVTQRGPRDDQAQLWDWRQLTSDELMISMRPPSVNHRNMGLKDLLKENKVLNYFKL